MKKLVLWLALAVLAVSLSPPAQASENKEFLNFAKTAGAAGTQVTLAPLVDLNLLWDIKSGNTIAAIATPAGALTSPKTHRVVAMAYVLGGADLTSKDLVGCIGIARTGHFYEQLLYRAGVFGGVSNDTSRTWRGGLFIGVTLQF